MRSAISYLKELFRCEKRLIARFVATSLGRAISSVGLIFLVEQFLTVEVGRSSRLTNGLAYIFGRAALPWVLACMLILAYIGTSLMTYCNRVTIQQGIKVLELGVMHRLLGHLLSLSLPFFQRHKHGDLIQALRVDISCLRMAVQGSANIFLEGLMALALLLIATWFSASLAFVAFCLVPLAYIPLRYHLKRIQAAAAQIRLSGSGMFDTILQILSGIRIIKAYQGEKTQLETSLANARVYFDANIEVVRIRSLSQALLESLASLGVVSVIIVGGFEVRRGMLTWPAMFAFILALRTLQGPLYNCYNSLTEIQTYGVGIKRLRELLATEPEIRDGPGALPLVSPPQLIRFENVSFSFDGNTSVLRDISFEVRAGETVGIVGASGAGKSTLLNLAVRFFEPTSGRILFDGRDIRHYKIADLYRHIAIVAQDPFLFATTVRQNIRCGRPGATDEEVEAAARAAFIHEDVMAMPQGYETEIGVGARELSRGQAQRINMARALLKNSPLLILDEATSSLDAVSEEAVQQSIDRLVEGRTTLVVAHRLFTLKNAHRLLVLHDGRCVGFGTHQDLIRDNPTYARLWQLQDISARPDAGARAAQAVVDGGAFDSGEVGPFSSPAPQTVCGNPSL